jgi:hypothetical protein
MRAPHLPVYEIDLKMTNSGLGLVERFRQRPFTTDIGFVVVDVHSHRVPPVDEVIQQARGEVRRELRAAARGEPDRQVWSPPTFSTRKHAGRTSSTCSRLRGSVAWSLRRSLGNEVGG